MKVVQLNPSVILHGSLIEPGTFESLVGIGWGQVFNIGTSPGNRVYRVEFIQDVRIPASEIEWPWVMIQGNADDSNSLCGEDSEELIEFAIEAILARREALEAKKKKDEKEAKKAEKKV